MSGETDLVLIGTVDSQEFGGEHDVVSVNVFDGPDIAPIRLGVLPPGPGPLATAWLTKEQTRGLVILLESALDRAEEGEPPKPGSMTEEKT